MTANRALTPGAWDPSATVADVCMKGYAASRRPGIWASLKLKGQALKHYGLARTPANWHAYTLDHLVPLELGGLPLTLDNAWPQPKVEARRKDRDENAYKHGVCQGQVTLANAQLHFVTAWSA